MPDAELASSILEPAELENLVDRTDIRDIRLQRFTGELRRTPPEELQVRVQTSEPQFARENGAILALFTHRLEYVAPIEGEDEPTVVGHIETTHIVELALRGTEDPSDESISAFIAGNVLFMVFPYVRSALHRLPGEFGLPPILMPYLRRNTIGVVVPSSEHDETANAEHDSNT